MLMADASQSVSTPNITAARMPPSDIVNRKTFIDAIWALGRMGASGQGAACASATAEAWHRHGCRSRALAPLATLVAIAFANRNAALEHFACDGCGHLVDRDA